MSYDVQQVVTDKIVAALETGVAPWVKSWRTTGATAHRNAVSGHEYSGVNLLTTWAESMVRGYADSRWLTMHQATDLGGSLKKGQGKLYIPIVWWGRRDYGTDRDGNAYTDADGNATTRSAWILRASYVYNVAQFDGLPAKYTAEDARIPAVGFDAALAVVEASGIVVRHGGERAFYRPSEDAVTMPLPQSFATDGAYYATLFHELTHATGHADRLGRDLGGKFGSDRYAAEELIAELGAAFLCAETGVDSVVREDHASYLASWLKVLKADKTAIFTASKHAKTATEWLTARVGAESMAAK